MQGVGGGADGLHRTRIDAVVGELAHVGRKHDHAAFRESAREAHEPRLVDGQPMDAVHEHEPRRIGHAARPIPPQMSRAVTIFVDLVEAAIRGRERARRLTRETAKDVRCAPMRAHPRPEDDREKHRSQEAHHHCDSPAHRARRAALRHVW
jgi:hypothetical protein